VKGEKEVPVEMETCCLVQSKWRGMWVTAFHAVHSTDLDVDQHSLSTIFYYFNA
jgi:hypothetical protein